MHPPPSLTYLTLLLLTHHSLPHPLAAPTCSCEGYTVPSPSSSNATLFFTQILETDFLHVRDIADVDEHWLPQAYNVTPAAARGLYGKAARVENIVAWPVAAGRENPGLRLWVGGERAGDMVTMAEVVSVRDDVLFGSFRIGMKGTAVQGTCAAFFFYFDDAEEIDMEFLSRDPGAVNLVVQSWESREVGYVAPDSGDFERSELGWRAGDGYHEYRFDWSPGSIDFYADSRLLKRMRTNVPQAAGRIHISHWSNGDAGWSGGPPQEAAAVTVSYVKAYFNSSVDALNVVDGEGCAPCEVPNVETLADPTGPNGNGTGHTTFFSDDPAGQTGASSGGEGEGEGPKQDTAPGLSFPALMSCTVLLVLWNAII